MLKFNQKVNAPRAKEKASAPVSNVTEDVQEDVRGFEEEEVSVQKEADIKDVIGVIGAYMDQVNYCVQNAVPSDASQRYKDLKKANLEKDPSERITNKPKLDSNYEEITKADKRGTVKADDPYSQTNFRSLYTEEFKAMLAEGYVKVVMAETKPSGFIVQNFSKEPGKSDDDEAIRINEKLTGKALAYDFDKGTFLIKRKDLVNFMANSTCPEIKAYRPSGNELGESIGSILMKEKKTSDENKHNFDLVYVKREANGMRNPVPFYKLGMKYACNRDNQNPSTKGTIITKELVDAGKVTNLDTVKDVFGEDYDVTALGLHYGKLLSKASSPLSDNEYTDLVKSTYIQYSNNKKDKGYGKRFAEVGITPDMLTQIRTKGSTTRRRVDYTEVYQGSVDAMNAYLTYMQD